MLLKTSLSGPGKSVHVPFAGLYCSKSGSRRHFSQMFRQAHLSKPWRAEQLTLLWTRSVMPFGCRLIGSDGHNRANLQTLVEPRSPKRGTCDVFTVVTGLTECRAAGKSLSKTHLSLIPFWIDLREVFFHIQRIV